MRIGRCCLALMCRSGVAIALCGLLSFSAVADTKIAILDFELNDLTLDPRRPDELERTASIKTLLQETLNRKGGYDLIEIDSDVRGKADAGFGYLFAHHDVAGTLGKEFGADWVLVGRVHKASFSRLFILWPIWWMLMRKSWSGTISSKSKVLREFSRSRALNVLPKKSIKPSRQSSTATYDRPPTSHNELCWLQSFYNRGIMALWKRLLYQK